MWHSKRNQRDSRSRQVNCPPTGKDGKRPVLHFALHGFEEYVNPCGARSFCLHRLNTFGAFGVRGSLRAPMPIAEMEPMVGAPPPHCPSADTMHASVSRFYRDHDGSDSKHKRIPNELG